MKNYPPIVREIYVRFDKDLIHSEIAIEPDVFKL